MLGWRSVPVNTSIVGPNAQETMSNIQQVFVQISKEDIDGIERKLYICRELIERTASTEIWGNLYFCSLSKQTIVYKGMFRSKVFDLFYLDLKVIFINLLSLFTTEDAVQIQVL